MVLSGLTFSRCFGRVALVLLFFVTVGGLRAQQAEVAGTMPEDHLPELKEILAVALRQSPQMLLAAIDVERAEAGRIQARAARLPGLSGDLNYASNQEAVSSNSSTQSRATGLFYRVSLGQSLFHWNALANQSAIGRIGLLLAEKNSVEAYRLLSVTLRQSYLELIVEKARMRHARFLFERGQGDLALMRENAAQFSPAAISGRELQLRESKLELDRSEARFAASLRRFGRIAGLRPNEMPESRVADELPLPKVAPALVGAVTAMVLREQGAQAYEPQILALKVREADLRHRIERVRLLPKFDLGAGYSLNNSSTVGSNRVEQQAVQQQNISIGAQWRFFDGFATGAAKKDARAVKRAYELRLSKAVEELLEQVQTLERTLQLDAEQMDISNTHVEMALEGKRRAAEESEAGQLPKAEVERADAGIYFNRAKAFEARARFFADWTELVSISGIDPVLENVNNRHAREKR